MADSIRDALTAAFSASEKEPDETPTPATETETPDSVSSETPDDGNLSPTSDTTDDSDESGGSPPPPASVAAAPAVPAEAPKPPASWSASERESWAALPEGARAAVLRREQEFDRVLRTSSEARKRMQAMDSIATPYTPLLQKYGVTIEQAIQPLLATRAALEVGTPEQKAELVANLIADFGIDVEQLDTAIVGRLQRGPAPQHAAPPALDLRNHPELRGLFQMADEVKERRAAAAREALAEVSTLPHYEDVRMEMADVLDRARARGKTLDLRQAYNIACQVYGLEGAPAPLSPSDAGRALALSRNAASSVAGGLKPSPPRAPGSGSLRDELEANFRSARR